LVGIAFAFFTSFSVELRAFPYAPITTFGKHNIELRKTLQSERPASRSLKQHTFETTKMKLKSLARIDTRLNWLLGGELSDGYRRDCPYAWQAC